MMALVASNAFWVSKLQECRPDKAAGAAAQTYAAVFRYAVKNGTVFGERSREYLSRKDARVMCSVSEAVGAYS